jgi:HK97 family phage major capsid protein
MEFTPEQAVEIVNKAVSEFKGVFAPEVKSQIDELKTELLGEIKGAITQEKLDTAIQNLELKMDQFAEKMKPVETKSLSERFEAELIEKVGEIKTGAKEVKFEVKSITSSELVAPKFNTEVDPNAKLPNLRKPTLMDLIRKSPLGKRDHVKIALTATPYCAYQAEAGAMTVTSSTGTAAETTFPAQKIVARANGISREALLEDTPSIVNKILQDLRNQFYLFLENECINGLGATGVTDKIWGILPQFTTAFNATTAGVNGTVTSPNYYDLALAMKLQAQTAATNREFMPSVLLCSPATMYKIRTSKDGDNKPLMLDGMLGGEFTVIENRTLTGDQMLLIDPSVFEMFVGRNFELEITQDTYPVTSGQTTTTYSDKSYDTFSVIAWFRGMLTMNLADKGGNIYVANIATELGNIKKPA